MKKLEPARTVMTAEELYHVPSELPGVGDRFYELDQGVLLVREPGGYYHSNIGHELAMHLGSYAKRHKLGVVVGADMGFVLQRDPDTVLSPDVAFIDVTRIPTGDAESKYLEGAPDLAVEIVSPSDRLAALDRKMRKYLDAGTRLGWVVNKQRETVTLYRKDTIPRVLTVDHYLSGEDVIPGFRMAIRELYRGA